MKLGCLILYHPKVSSVTKSKLLRSMFFQHLFEIEVEENRTVIAFVWNVEQKEIWHAAALFEFSNITCGYGFGLNKKEARKRADQVLSTILSTKDSGS
jgi:hypothetical protein